MNRPDWFNNAIVSGLQWLVVMSLRGTPPEDIMEFTREAWQDTVWRSQALWDQAADEQRLSAGFLRLRQSMDRWPAPKNLLDAMPQRREVPKLPEPPITPE